MLTTELPSSTTLATAATSSASLLRLHGGTEDNRLIPIPVGKLSIGSGPRCAVRLAYDGVRPMHCLITRDGQSLRVRRWADGILLNGVPFDEASLAPGDRLAIGSVELEVVGTAPQDDATALPAESHPPVAAANVPPDANQNADSEKNDATADSSPLVPAVPDPSPTVASPNRLTRARRRRLLAALRFHHRMGVQLDRAVTSLEQQLSEVSTGQADSTAENTRLAGTLAALVDQVREYRHEQSLLEQRHADLLEKSHGWNSRLDEQQQTLHGFERSAEHSRELGGSLHRRGRKLVASLRKGRESFRVLNERLAGLEQQTQASSAERDRLREDFAKAIEQQSAQETQSAAWNAVVEATDRLSDNYKHLVAENSRFAGEIQKLTTTRGELAAEKAAASEMLALLRDQYNENQQRQADFDFQRGQWRDELRAWETRVVERDEWADRFERELSGIRSSFDVPTVPIVEWKSLSEQVASLTGQQSEHIRQRATWESRVADCETHIAGRDERIDAVQREVQSLRKETQEQASRTANWTAIADQVASLAGQQAEWDNERRAVRDRVDDCEARLTERLQQLGDVERQLVELRATCQDQSTQAGLWTTLSEQVASLLNEQTEWKNEQHAVRSRVDNCETRLAERLQQFGEFERQVTELQAACQEQSTQATGWSALSKQVASLKEQQTEWEQRRSAWQGRVEQCETQFVDLGRKLATVEQLVDKLPAATSEPPIPVAEWTALAEQVGSLRNEQAELAAQRTAWEARLTEWETQLAAGAQQFGDLASTLEAVRSAHHDQATQVTELTSLVEQLAALQRQQGDVDHLRSEWQNQVVEWETQLQQRLGQFEAYEHELQQLRAVQQQQATLVCQLASQERVVRQTEGSIPDSAQAPDLSDRSPVEPPNADQGWTSNDAEASQTTSPATDELTLADEAATSEPVVETEPVPTAAPAPVSYLEKYAHIFEEDDSEGPAESRPTLPLHASPRANPSEPSQALASEDDHASHGDEESVEQYMAKLMQRMRGDSHRSTASSTSSTIETDTSDAPASTAYATEAATSDTASEGAPWSTVSIVDEATDGPLLNDLEEMKPKTPAPAFAADLQALRALANQSARHAIGVHTARKLRRNALMRCLIAVLAVVAGSCLLFYSPGWRSLQFAGACVAMSAAVFWIKRSYDSLTKAIRVGAFQQFDDDVSEDGGAPVHPPLPIDVDLSGTNRSDTDRSKAEH